jgi:hypothetical protein
MAQHPNPLPKASIRRKNNRIQGWQYEPMGKKRMKRNLGKGFGIFLGAFNYLVIFMSCVIALAGNVGDGTSPFGCGSNCQAGGYELSGNSEAYCNANPVDCYNTIDDCKDGTKDTWEYINDLNITSLNDTRFRVGDMVEIDVDVYSGSSGFDQVIILYTNNSVSSNTNWTVIHSEGFQETISSKHFKTNKTLDNVNRTHSIRAIVEYKQYTNITCGTGTGSTWPIYSDTDDISFLVSPDDVNPSINFTSPTPANNGTLTVTSVTINVTHNDTRPAFLILNWNGTNQTPIQWSGPYTNIIMSNLQRSNYTYYVWVNDTSGNQNYTETRTLEIITPIDLTIQSPTDQAVSVNSTISLNFTAKSNTPNSIISWSGYSLNGNSNVTAMGKLNITSDLSDGEGPLNESTLASLNLSQSFIPAESMDLSNLSIKLMKVGSGTENATLQIRTDNSGPSSTVLAAVNISNNNVSNSSFTWVNLGLNASTPLSANTKYWLFLSPNGSSTDYYIWEATDDNDYVPGNFSQNGSRDLLFRAFDDFKYRTTLLGSEGANNLTLYANDTSANTISSSTITFTVDTVPPVFTKITESQDPLEIGNQETLWINVSDASSSVNTVLVEFNGSNYTMLADTAPRYYYTWTPNGTGNITYRFYMNDTAGNQNMTDYFNFTVTDNTAPLIANISYSPNSSQDLYPNANITVSATVTDSHNVNLVFLQYKNTTGSWLNATMLNPSGDLYRGNFTPYTIENWTFRLWSRDPTGNENISSNYTLYVDYDWTWTLYPLSFDTVGGVINTLVNIGNLTINNTGDYNLTFNITYTGTPSVVFNVTSPVIIYAKDMLSININATAPGVEAEYPISILVEAVNQSASPQQRTSNVTLAAVTSGPYLTISITEFDSSVTQGDRTANLAAKITNVGNETAHNVTANWTLPSGWASSSDLNLSLGNLTTGQFKWHNISVLVSSSAGTGAQTITAQANCTEGRYNSDSKTVTVSAAQGQVTTPPSSSSGGGGGGGGGIAYGPPSYDFTIQSPSSVTATPNSEVTVLINITNAIKGTTLNNITMDVQGYFLTFMDWSPERITRLAYNETKFFELKASIPKYMKSAKYPLLLSVKVVGKDALDNSSSDRSLKYLEKSVSVLLIVQEIGKEESINSLLRAQADIDEMEKASLNIRTASELLDRAKAALEEKDYTQVFDLSSKISAIKSDAFSAKDIIDKIKEKALNTKGNEDIIKMLEPAQRALEEGDFSLALELANKASYAQQVEQGYRESGWTYVARDFIRENWASLLIIMLVSALAGLFIRAKISTGYIEGRIRDSQTQETSVFALIKKAQEQYFKEKIMSPRLYKKTMNELKKRVTSIEQNRIRLRSQIVKILKFKRNKAELEKELSYLDDNMKSLQQKYFQKKIITTEAYDQALDDYNIRKADIEKTISMLEKKKEKEVQKEPKIQKEDVVFFATPTPPKHEESPKSRISFDVDPENCFWINNGPIIKNVFELEGALRTIDEATFFHHVNKEKNDIASWVRDVIGNHALADKLGKTSSRTEMVDIIRENFAITGKKEPLTDSGTLKNFQGGFRNIFRKKVKA